jgi:hypothetical protein
MGCVRCRRGRVWVPCRGRPGCIPGRERSNRLHQQGVRLAATRDWGTFSSWSRPGPTLVEDRDGAAERPGAARARYLSRRGTLLRQRPRLVAERRAARIRLALGGGPQRNTGQDRAGAIRRLSSQTGCQRWPGDTKHRRGRPTGGGSPSRVGPEGACTPCEATALPCASSWRMPNYGRRGR